MPFRTAIAGLRAATTDLNVIANNVSNGNTTGFKKSRTEFSDVYAVANGASGKAVGSGVDVQRVAQQFSQGNIAFTDNGLDLGISGEGFFIVDDNGARSFTRAGAFGVNKDGYVVNGHNQRLVAFEADDAGNITGALSPLQVPAGNIEPRPSSLVNLNLNLDSSKTPPPVAFDPTDATSYNNSTSTTIYDSLGTSHLATVYYVKTAAANTWNSYTYVDGAAVSGPDALTFSGTGQLAVPATGRITLPAFTPAGGAGAMNVDLDYGTSTQYGSAFSVHNITQDGFTTGELAGLDIDKTGIVSERFSNGQTKIIGQVAVAKFQNQQGLRPIGESNWDETVDSGTAIATAPGTSGVGLVQAGALEESNVDMAEELVKMIVAQRNFQANTEVIRTADTVTQSIINIR
ncbi:MAG: flagellar hook protein FlgE [Gammaproteobacteria bacterium]